MCRICEHCYWPFCTAGMNSGCPACAPPDSEWLWWIHRVMAHRVPELTVLDGLGTPSHTLGTGALLHSCSVCRWRAQRFCVVGPVVGSSCNVRLRHWSRSLLIPLEPRPLAVSYQVLGRHIMPVLPAATTAKPNPPNAYQTFATSSGGRQ